MQQPVRDSDLLIDEGLVAYHQHLRSDEDGDRRPDRTLSSHYQDRNGTVVAAMMQLQRLTAACPSEICEMTPGEIDRREDIWVYSPRKHKNACRNKTRCIPLGVKCQKILLPFLAKCHSARTRLTHRCGDAKLSLDRRGAQRPSELQRPLVEAKSDIIVARFFLRAN
jgi:hypothetical protein